MKADWWYWRLFVGHHATLHELEERYCLDDIIDMNAALDIQQESEARAQQEAQQRGGKQ